MALKTTKQYADDPRRYLQLVRSGVRTAEDFTIEVGFDPIAIKVTNLTDKISAEWFREANMVDAAKQLKTVAAGTRTFEDCGITVDGRNVSVDISVALLESDDDITLVEVWG